MRIVIAGGRDFTNTDIAFICIEPLVKAGDIIVSGHASGADHIGELYAENHKLECKLYPANWKAYGRAAGPIRNKQMAKVADKLIAFWDGKSRGTKNMINLAKKYNFKGKVFDYQGNLVEEF